MSQVLENSFWQFRAEEEGRLQMHKVIFSENGEVTSIGIPFGTGWSWHGPEALFLKQFRLARSK